MAISAKIQYARVDDLNLDPDNPRLGRAFTKREATQGEILDAMSDWSLDELATSFMESGFWPHEAVLAIKQRLYGTERLVVVEGNRRLAALKFLKEAVDGLHASRRWIDIARSGAVPQRLFDEVPYILIDSRKDVASFLGFRHVTGIKEWDPAEKAEFIAQLIEEFGLSYEEVRRKIGSKAATVRQNYISYRLLLQMEGSEDIQTEKVEERFSVLYLSLKSAGVQRYLQIDMSASPDAARMPVPKDRLKALGRFALWLFGAEDIDPIISDSRQVDEFGIALGNDKAVAYLERTERPSLQVAYRLAGGDEDEVIQSIEKAADYVEAALTRAHAHKTSRKLGSAVERLLQDTEQLGNVFPAIQQKVRSA